MTQTTTMTIRLDKKLERELAKIAAHEKRSKSFLAAEAVASFLEMRAVQEAGIEKAITSLSKGKGIPHQDMLDWALRLKAKRS